MIFGSGDVHGGVVGNGPTALVTAANTTPLSDYHTLDLFRVVPDNGTTGASQAGSLSWHPWFDTDGGVTYTISASNSTTLTVSPDPSWTTNEWAGNAVTNSNASPFYGFQNLRIAVVSNTSDTITVSAWTTTPTVGTIMHFNEGRFEDYHALGAGRPYTELAASPSYRGGGSAQQQNVGIGYDAGLLRELYENVYKTSPYFVAAKFGAANPTTNSYATAGAERTTFETWFARVTAAFATRYPSDTLDWRYVIINLAHADVQDWISNTGTAAARRASYAADTQAVISWLRSGPFDPQATPRFLLINHDHSIRGVDLPGGIAWTASQHMAVAAADANVRTVDFNGRGFDTRGVAATKTQPNEDRTFYAPHVYYKEASSVIRKAIGLWEEGAAASIDGAIPVYILIGDSTETSTYLTTAYTTALASSTLTTTARDSRQKIYNRVTSAVEIYHAHYNSLTSGSAQAAPTALAGAEFSLTHELMNRHPDTGFVIIKRASTTSSLIANATAYSSGTGGRWSKTYSATEHYGELETDIETALLYINKTLGRQAELMAFFVGLGTHDSTVAGGGDLFASTLTSFCASLRDDFGTHTTGKETPIIWRKPQLGASGAIGAEMLTIRAALETRAKADGQFRLMDVDGLDRGADDVNLTPDSVIAFGRSYNTELERVDLPNCGT